MKFLITGGAGFIGSSVTDKLLETGNSVICLDSFDDFYNPSIKRENIRKALQHKNYLLVEEDIRNKSFLEKFLSENKVDAVIHLAARAGVRPSIANPELYYDVNLNGTLVLLEEMRKANITKMIFASSSSVYGNNEKVPFSEDDNVDFPISPYAASKKSAELLCHTYHHLYAFDIFCLRFFTVYGPRQRPEMAIHKFARNIMSKKAIQMFGDGSSKRDYTYIDDIVSGVIGSVNNLKGYEIVNLGESQTISLANLITVLEKKIGTKAIIEKLPEQPGDVSVTNADISKARRILNYSPQTTIEEGIDKFVSWVLKKKTDTLVP